MIKKTLLALAAFGALASTAQADTYTLQGVIQEGAKTGTLFSGMFSFDDSLLPSAEGWLPLTALSLSYDGQTYTLAGAEAGSSVSFDFDGSTVLGIDASWNNGAVLLTSGFGSPFLADADNNIGAYTVTAAAAVPEPSSWMLGLTGLAMMGAVVRRRKAQ